VPAKFVVKKGSTGKYRFNLVASNGQVVATSEAYETRAKALAGIESVRKNAAGAVLVDGTAPAAKPAAKAAASTTAAKPATRSAAAKAPAKSVKKAASSEALKGATGSARPGPAAKAAKAVKIAVAKAKP
jgi:hypothetical protein